jgi:peptidylprolyl isomerase
MAALVFRAAVATSTAGTGGESAVAPPPAFGHHVAWRRGAPATPGIPADRKVNPTMAMSRPTRCSLLPLLAAVLFPALLAGCGDPVREALEGPGYHVEDITLGEGDTAAAGDYVTVTAVLGRWWDGQRGDQLDRTDGDGVGFVLGAGEAMPGWDAGLVGLRVGGTRRLLLAPGMVGDTHRPGGVGADDVLWCEVTLVDVARVAVVDREPGEGDAVAPGDYDRITYQGWRLQDGVRGDLIASSDGDGPVGVMLGARMVNRGLELGLAGMRPGGVREVTVPPALAYGRQGRDDVPPDATLVYEVRLVDRPRVEQEIVREGSGDPVQPGQRVRFHLDGWIAGPDGAKGEQFQDTRRLRMPADVILGSFKIQPGLELGIRGMKPGELRRLHVPAALAFGSRGWFRGDRVVVAPDTDVIYEVDLVSAGPATR